MRKFILAFTLLIPCVVHAGTMTWSFNPIGSIAFSTWTAVPPPAVALTTHTAKSSVDTNGFTTAALNTTGANLLIVAISTYTLGASFTGISDSLSNVWTRLNTYVVASNQTVTMYYSSSAIVGAAQTFTVSGSGCYPGMAVAAFSNSASNPFDSQNGASTASGTTLQPGSVTPSKDNELVVTGFSMQTAGTGSINSSFIVADQASQTATGFGVALGYIINGTGTSGVPINPTWTFSGSATGLASDIAVFKGP